MAKTRKALCKKVQNLKKLLLSLHSCRCCVSKASFQTQTSSQTWDTAIGLVIFSSITENLQNGPTGRKSSWPTQGNGFCYCAWLVYEGSHLLCNVAEIMTKQTKHIVLSKLNRLSPEERTYLIVLNGIRFPVSWYEITLLSAKCI